MSQQKRARSGADADMYVNKAAVVISPELQVGSEPVLEVCQYTHPTWPYSLAVSHDFCLNMSAE